MNLSETRSVSESDAAADGKDFAHFQKRLNLLAASLIVVVTLVYLLQMFATVLQQLLVAVFIVYLIMPPYYWLVRRGLSPILSRILVLTAIVLAVAVLGVVVGSSVADLEAKLPQYREALKHVIVESAAVVPGLGDKARDLWETGTPQTLDQVIRFAQVGLQALSNFASQCFVVVIYVLFILAERAGIRQRAVLAFPPQQVKRLTWRPPAMSIPWAWCSIN